ncbi:MULTISPECIES: hypothetical protein [unclassified Fusibacter]|uniref:hypothetical protein n=1 Tax=unclassified Fusibacter TaxID=2624464 RepID=UPI00101386BC|nr:MULTISPECIES: hypothetical protein [unclassified Fusibacter]MCK8061394.1 hypothetical protein [Fusibacter sp. A2]NPE23563.1 hypothetical protein [Fusibacter sp. A1]RXV58973.1 hypothetical protein DWB64_17395 [Fusibacter sp. A1]
MARNIRIKVIDGDTNVNFSLPIGLITRLLRIGVDIFSLFQKQLTADKFTMDTKDLKEVAAFFDALKEVDPFTFVEVEDGDTKVLIRTE